MGSSGRLRRRHPTERLESLDDRFPVTCRCSGRDWSGPRPETALGRVADRHGDPEPDSTSNGRQHAGHEQTGQAPLPPPQVGNGRLRRTLAIPDSDAAPRTQERRVGDPEGITRHLLDDQGGQGVGTQDERRELRHPAIGIPAEGSPASVEARCGL